MVLYYCTNVGFKRIFKRSVEWIYLTLTMPGETTEWTNDVSFKNDGIFFFWYLRLNVD